MRGLHFVLVSSVLAGTAMIECSNDKSTCDDAGNCTDGGVPSVSGGGCDSSKPASQGGCAVDDTDGFFVSINGADTNPGTKVAPFKTIGAGIVAASASAKQPNVYVCVGAFPENLVIKSAAAGVALHGGFDCTSWVQANGLTQVAPTWIANATQPQYVLRVDATAALVEGMTLMAPNAADPGASSVAVFVSASPGMTVRRSTIVSGNGSTGADAAQPTPIGANSAGTSTSDGTAPPAKICNCSTDSTTGGSGGGFVDAGFVPPGNGLPVINGDMDAGHAGTTTSPPGVDGANGLKGKDATSAASLGVLTSNGWLPSSGIAGATGGTAQGGGGAWGDPGSNVSGGSGGCGGCGGTGGPGGAGGGGSIGVAALSATLRIQSSTIRAGNAGNGGNGALGQIGQVGGIGGKNLAPGGGMGGTGGGGGSGGGGAGGVSIAIATVSTTPDIDQQSTILAGTAGQGGKDATAAQNKAIDGLAAAVHGF
jgi:hypothetical protein